MENFRSSKPPKQQSTLSKPMASSTIIVKELPLVVEEVHNKDRQQREVPQGSISQNGSENEQPHNGVTKKNIIEDTTKVYPVSEPLVNSELVAQVQALNDVTKQSTTSEKIGSTEDPQLLITGIQNATWKTNKYKLYCFKKSPLKQKVLQ